MRFLETPLPGLRIVEHEPRADQRGDFARLYCRQAFAAAGLNPDLPQINLSRNRSRGTLRGLHFQAPPHEESKVVQRMAGRLFDVAIDLRPGSPTYCRWHAVELAAGDGRAFYIPAGFAHGFQTLEDDTEVLYLMGAAYSPGHARGVRWNDPAFAIDWPLAEAILSDKDQAYPDFRP